MSDSDVDKVPLRLMSGKGEQVALVLTAHW